MVKIKKQKKLDKIIYFIMGKNVYVYNKFTYLISQLLKLIDK